MHNVRTRVYGMLSHFVLSSTLAAQDYRSEAESSVLHYANSWSRLGFSQQGVMSAALPANENLSSAGKLLEDRSSRTAARSIANSTRGSASKKATE